MQRFAVLYTHCYTSLLSFVAQPAAVFYMWYSDTALNRQEYLPFVMEFGLI